MNPSPDRNKECLPPKKRESRQGSSDQATTEDDFKPPAPLRARRHHHSTEGYRESADLQAPSLPPLPSLSMSLPWQASYVPSMHHSYLPGQVCERRGLVSASWRDAMCGRGLDGGLEHPASHHSRWLRGDIPPLNVQPMISVPTFKSIYTSESREMWPYSHSRQDYGSSFFSSHLFSQPTVYAHDTLPDSRLRYQGRWPNGVDGLDSRFVSNRRGPFCNDYRNNSMTRLDGYYANGKRRQEGTAGQSTGKGLMSQESTSAHSSPRDRNPRGTPKAPMLSLSDAKAGKIKTSQDHYSESASQAGAQIYYALGSLCPSAHQELSPSNRPFCPLRHSQHSTHSQQNSQQAKTDWDTSAGHSHPALAVFTGPDPPPSAVLPHFAKGSLIELAGGCLKKVEELKTEDFLRSADTLPEFHLSTCTVLLISPGPTHGFNHLQVLLTDRNTQELLTVLAEYPFFVRDHGWSSCSPQRSAQLYGLQCRQLSTGDVCLALTPTPTPLLKHSGSPPPCLVVRSGAGLGTCTDTEERMPPPPAPPPLPVAQPSAPGLLRERKRRWSAPELQSARETSSHLPQGCCKQERRQ